MTISFTELGLMPALLRALADAQYTTPTPIQAKAIPILFEGKDLLGIAQTGTGKTAAFALPILQRLAAQPEKAGPRGARVLVLTPTRELAIQIDDSFRTYGKHLGLRRALVFGGVGQKPQVDALQRGVDILVATPGRLLDLMGQGHVKLDKLVCFVLDEADRMLDMGFITDVRRIAATLPKQRQTLLFSATMPPDIARLASSILRDPVRVEVTPAATTVELIDQRVMLVDSTNKRALLAHVLKDTSIRRALVFTRTKHGANRVVEQLERAGIAAEAIHGNKSQTARQRALENFKAGRTRLLIATDIASRGIDIDDVTHVINYELPNIPESYVHRIGRTARAGASGVAISFCDTAERVFLRDIEKLTGRQLTVIADHPYPATGQRSANVEPQQQRRPQQNQGRRFGRRAA